MKRLLGKVVVVTGAARGQGAAEAEALTREGARVIATDVRDAPGCRRLDDALPEDFARVHAVNGAAGPVEGVRPGAGPAWHPDQHDPPRVHRDGDDRVRRARLP